MPSGLSFIVACVRISFLFKAGYYSIVCIYNCYPFSVGGHLGYICLLSIMNNAALLMGIQIPPPHSASNSPGFIRRSGIAGSHSNSFFFFFSYFCGTVILFSTATALFYILFSHQCTQGLQFLHILTSAVLLEFICFLFLWFFDSNHPNGYEMIHHCDSDLHFSNN